MTVRFLIVFTFMATHKLTNYLRTYRKRLGFSQDEIAFLLECKSGAKVSRYEHFGREPGLRTALACEAIFQVPVRELFAGIYQKVEKKTLAKIRSLSEKLHASDVPHPRHARRRAQVEAALLSRLINTSHKHE
jgi:transcriptional regulator with XRE-family HTH domain